MNAERLMDAIGGISDRYIEEFAVIKTISLAKSTLKKLTLIAACVLLAIGICSLIRINFLRTDVDKVPDIVACIVEDDYYEIVSDEKVISSRGLPQTITSDMMGAYIGECIIEENGKAAKAYEYLGFKGDSILIVELESRHYYLFFCNRYENNTPISMQELLNKYGLTDNIATISVNGKATSLTTASLTKELSEAVAVTGNEFNEIIFSGKSEEEQQVISEKLAQERIEIIIRGNLSDTLVIDYYPSIGYGFSANTYYKFTPELIKLLK